MRQRSVHRRDNERNERKFDFGTSEYDNPAEKKIIGTPE
jgi:hypothetical protein